MAAVYGMCCDRIRFIQKTTRHRVVVVFVKHDTMTGGDPTSSANCVKRVFYRVAFMQICFGITYYAGAVSRHARPQGVKRRWNQSLCHMYIFPKPMKITHAQVSVLGRAPPQSTAGQIPYPCTIQSSGRPNGNLHAVKHYCGSFRVIGLIRNAKPFTQRPFAMASEYV